MEYPKSELRHFKAMMSRLLLHLRQKDTPVKQKDVAAFIGKSVRSLNNIENGQSITDDFLLLLYHFYHFTGRVTPAEARLFFYLFRRLQQKR